MNILSKVRRQQTSELALCILMHIEYVRKTLQLQQLDIEQCRFKMDDNGDLINTANDNASYSWATIIHTEEKLNQLWTTLC